MAKINIVEIIDHLEDDIRKSLEATIRANFPNQDFNSRTVFKTFKTQIDKRSKSWETVPNKFIRSE